MGLTQARIVSALGGLSALVAVQSIPEQAQAQIFCPTTALGQNGMVYSGTQCTNGPAGGIGGTGALSTAALASGSLSEIAEVTTQQTTAQTLEAVKERRKQETERCPDGYERVSGQCRRIVVARPRTSSAPPPIVYKAPPPPYIEQGRFGVWANGFGDYERRTGSGVVTVVGNGINLAAGITSAVAIDSKTTTWGFLSGGDVTYHNVAAGGDLLIAGLLFGYTSSDVTLSSTSTQANVANSSSAIKTRVSGPTVGGYATYVTGPWSLEQTLKVDLLSINESFTETFVFAGVAAGPATFAASGSAHVNNYTAAGNVNYRIGLSPEVWLEPTAGYVYTYSSYDAAAAALNLANGYVWRVQGGARLGADYMWNTVHVTPTLTGIAYDDVKVSGGAIAGGATPIAPLLLPDQGKVRVEGILAMNFDYGNGFSSFIRGDVRGGQGLFGGGGRVGVRYQW